MGRIRISVVAAFVMAAMSATVMAGGASAAKAPTAAQMKRLETQVKSQKAVIAELRLQIRALKAQLALQTGGAGTTTTAPTALGTRANPYPADTQVALTGGWGMKVVGITPNATDQVLAENRYNDRPGEGRQFFMIRLSVTKLSGGSASFLSSLLRLVGSSNVEYSTFRDSCGVIPGRMASSEVFDGGTIEGAACWSVRTSDIGSLVMYDGDSSDRKFMKVG